MISEVESLAEGLSESHTDNSCNKAVPTGVCNIQHSAVVLYVDW